LFSLSHEAKLFFFINRIVRLKENCDWIYFNKGSIIAIFVFGLHVKWFILSLEESEIIGLSFDLANESFNELKKLQQLKKKE
jgi:hypothetical protein